VNAFHVIGGLFAVWAVALTALGVTHEDFPHPGAQTLAVALISISLALGTISAGILTAALEEEHEPEEAEAAPGGGLVLTADPSGALRYDKSSLEAPAGEVTIRMDNPSTVPHNVSIAGGGVDEEGRTVETGGVSTVRADLRRGEYEFYCSVPGHREAGMDGTLTVR
jgi:plastocyanin